MSDSRKDRKDIKGKFGKEKGSHISKGWKKGHQTQGLGERDEFDDDKFDWMEFRKRV